MAHYVISYDLKGSLNSDYEEISQIITRNSLASVKAWTTTWIVLSELTAEQLLGEIKSKLKIGDTAIVAEIASNISYQLNDEDKVKVDKVMQSGVFSIPTGGARLIS